MIYFWNAFTKITGWPVQKICFRTRIFYENRKKSSRRIKGPAIIICNHTSVFDYAVLLFVFASRTIRCQMAELLFEKRFLGTFLKMLGGIRVNRQSHDDGFISKSEHILKNGGVLLIFPESRLPLKGEERPLPFALTPAYLALSQGVPVIPVFTNGSYFSKKRASVIIGDAIDPYKAVDPETDEKDAAAKLTSVFREKIIQLGKELNEHEK